MKDINFKQLFEANQQAYSLNEQRLIKLAFITLKRISDQDVLSDVKISALLKTNKPTAVAVADAFESIDEHVASLTGVFQQTDIYLKLDSHAVFLLLLELNDATFKEEDYQPIMEKVFTEESESDTPMSINKLGIALLNVTDGSLYDGTFGYGGAAIAASKKAEENNLDLKMYGQEINPLTWAIAKLHLFLQDIFNVEVALGDTLQDPKFIEDGQLKTFDFIYMNFPFSMRLSNLLDLSNDRYNRFVYAKPKKNIGDAAFMQHAVKSLNEDGKAVLVVTNGVLFRAGEKELRTNLLSADLVEAVVALPENLFGNTAIQTNLLVLNKKKAKDREDRVLFINASADYQKGKRHKHLLTKEAIGKIKHTYDSGKKIEAYSKWVKHEDLIGDNLLCDKYLHDDKIETELFGTVIINREKITETSTTIPLQEVATIYRGINLAPKQIIEGKGPYKIIKLSDIDKDQVHLDQIQPAAVTVKKNLADYVVKAGDLLLSSRGATIKIAQVPEHEGIGILSQNFHGIRLKDKHDAQFIKAYLESPVGQFLLEKIQSGTSIKTINAKDLQVLPIPNIKSEKQKEIAATYLATTKAYQEKIKQAEQERKHALANIYSDMGITTYMEGI